MLGFLSFIVVALILSGAIGLIALTIRNASGSIGSALRGDTAPCVTLVTFNSRVITLPVRSCSNLGPLRVAA
jgi:hypothetical protein